MDNVTARHLEHNQRKCAQGCEEGRILEELQYCNTKDHTEKKEETASSYLVGRDQC